MANIIEAPEGAEFEVSFFLTSDESGLEIKLALGGMTILVDFTNKADAGKLAEHFNLDGLASDWRLMTRDEISDYKRREREEEAA